MLLYSMCSVLASYSPAREQQIRILRTKDFFQHISHLTANWRCLGPGRRVPKVTLVVVVVVVVVASSLSS